MAGLVPAISLLKSTASFAIGITGARPVMTENSMSSLDRPMPDVMPLVRKQRFGMCCIAPTAFVHYIR
ncbi:hypothetical protein DC522_11495 [Microvirga sp. KLBC 81]|nr:hypothetical protein DC522_11495 [Microvirga sp. KLBC 81]